MQKNIIITIALVCGCVLFASCAKDREPDLSLAGSIVLTDSANVEGVFGEPIMDRKLVEVSFEKVSDTETCFSCTICNADGSPYLKVRVPRIPLTGEPKRVSFDCVSPDAVVNYDGVEYSPVNLSIKGMVDLYMGSFVYLVNIKGVVGNRNMELRITPKYILID